MKTLRAWLVRLSGTFHRTRAERDLADELDAHLQLHIDDGIRAGLTPAEARRAARLALGSVDSIREAYRERARVPWLTAIGRDLWFASRVFRRQPGFAIGAVLTLALGVGVNTAVFGVVDAVVLRPLPYPSPERIVEIAGPGQGLVRFGRVLEVWPQALRAESTFGAIGLYVPGGANLGGEEAVRVAAAAVSPGFFDALAARPALGRTFTEADLAVSGSVVVLSNRIWRERFRADPAAVGQQVRIDGLTFDVIGVMPPGVSYPDGTALWLPTNGGTGVMGQIPVAKIVARLRDGVPLTAVRDRVVAAAGLRGHRATSLRVLPLRDALVGPVVPIAALVWIGAAVVLFMACVNVANLLLARVSRRHREFAVRRALGATRGQLVRQGIVESAILSFLGALLALPAAWWTIATARVVLPATLHGVPEIAFDVRFVAAMAVFSMLVAVLAGAGPSLAIARTKSALPTAAPVAGDRGWARFRGALIVGQIAASLVLLAAAAALVQSMRDLMQINIGARAERALAIEMNLPRARYESPAMAADFVARLDRALREIPGVEEVGVANQLPGRAPELLLAHPVAVQGHAGPGAPADGLLLNASPGFFAAAGIDLLAGRAFSDQDRTGSAPAAIVTEGFARLLGARPQDLIGRRLGESTRENAAPETIVGVVADVRLRGPEGRFETAVYVPYAVSPARVGATFVVVRAERDPLALAPAIRAAVARLDPDLPLYNMRTFDQIRSALVTERRLAMLAIVIFAILAVVLAAIGVYSVVSYAVELRTREIGIRLAIGATRWVMCREIVGSGLRQAIAGVSAGSAVALWMSTVASSTVHELARVSPALVVVVASGTVAVAVGATLVPALRAARVDPARTLQAE